MQAHGNSPKCAVQRASFRIMVPVCIGIIIAGLASAGLSQSASALLESSAPGGDASGESSQKFPFVAEITGNDVYIRSGPGTNYYHCGKLFKGDRVQVVGQQDGWSLVTPPAGSFSWIPMQYISINLEDPTMGVITGDGVRVYAGSDFVEPMHSTSWQWQALLKRGDKVKLLLEEKDEYYKIAPPSGSCVWVSSQYVKRATEVLEQERPRAIVPVPVPTDPCQPTLESPPIEVQMHEQFKELQKQVETERAKPLAEQSYANIKKALTEIAKNEQAGKVVRYAEFVLAQIERFELALAVAKTVKAQNEELQKIAKQIDETQAAKLEQVKDIGKFSVIGRLQEYRTYGDGHYKIVDESGKMVCYALPTGAAQATDMKKLLGDKVGLVGKIEPHMPTAGPLVRFTEVVPMK